MPCAAAARGSRPAGQEILFVLAKDIGDFQPMFTHR
jgi:hypothetical protein